MKTLDTMNSNFRKVSGIAMLILVFAQQAMSAGNNDKSNSPPQVRLDFTVTNLENSGDSRYRYFLKGAAVELLNRKTSLMEVYTTDANGKASISMKSKTAYEIIVRKEGFKPVTIKLYVDDITESLDYSENVELQKLDTSELAQN